MELKRLTPEVVNKLRSGVAIVSIAHCMEELVLNALDAGATCIAVRLNMPYHKVQVVDNGHGMSRDQLENCGERYCTSKCRTVSDLAHPKFYGYRGEALSSIVEMSGLVQIESKSSSCPQSCCKTFAQGKLRELAPSTANRPSAGTTVTVLDFMYNLPVRRGCVSEAIDFEFCLQHLEGIALSHPEVSFTLRNDVTGEKQFQTHKTSSVLDIFAQLFGARKAATLKQAFLKHKRLAVEAYISLEGHTTKQLQFVYLNKRLLLKTRIHKLVHNVIRKYVLGFQSKPVAPSGSPSKQRNRHPVFVIFIDCTSRTFDITYEPQKTFVEFTNWQTVIKLFEQLLNDFLHEHNVISHNFVINGELAFSQKTPPDCEGQQLSNTNTNAEQVPNALVSMKVHRKLPKHSTNLEDEPGRIQEDVTPQQRAVDERQYNGTQQVSETSAQEPVTSRRESSARIQHCRAPILLPPSFAAVSDARAKLCVPESESFLDIGEKFRFMRRNKPERTRPQTTGDHKKQQRACGTRVQKPAPRVQNRLISVTNARFLPQQKVAHKHLPDEPGYQKRPAQCTDSPLSDQEGIDTPACPMPDEGTELVRAPTTAFCTALHASNNATATTADSGLHRRHPTPDDRGPSVTKVAGALPKPIISSKVPFHEGPASKVDDCSVSRRFSRAVKKTPLAAKLRRKMKSQAPSGNVTSITACGTSTFFTRPDIPSRRNDSCLSFTRHCLTSESFLQTADDRCRHVLADQPLSLDVVDHLPSKTSRLDASAFSDVTTVGEPNTLYRLTSPNCQTQECISTAIPSVPFPCTQYFNPCSALKSRSEEDVSARLMENTQPFSVHLERGSQPAAIENTEADARCDSPIEVDRSSCSEDSVADVITDNGIADSPPATPVFTSQHSKGDLEGVCGPGFTRSCFSLRQLRLIQGGNTGSYSEQNDVNHASSSRSLPDVVFRDEAVSNTSRVAPDGASTSIGISGSQNGVQVANTCSPTHQEKVVHASSSESLPSVVFEDQVFLQASPAPPDRVSSPFIGNSSVQNAAQGEGTSCDSRSGNVIRALCFDSPPTSILQSEGQSETLPVAPDQTSPLVQHSNLQHVVQCDDTRSPSRQENLSDASSCESLPSAASQTEEVMEASPVAPDRASPSIRTSSSQNMETAENELAGLTQQSPLNSQPQESWSCEESNTAGISKSPQQPGCLDGDCLVRSEERPLISIAEDAARADDKTSAVETYPGNWVACTDPTTGKKMFINTMTGNSSFTAPSMCLEEPPPAQFRPRPPDERPQFGCTPDEEQADIADMVRTWNNPALTCAAGQDVVSGGLLSKDGACYKITQSYRFTKDMLTCVQVVGQVDCKYIACVLPLSRNGIVQEDSLVVLFDQHAAHERVRLEWLLENQYEARGQARCIRSSSLKSELTVALEPDTLRRAAMCEREMRKLGFHYTVQESGLSFSRLPACVLERDESELRYGRPSTLASRMEELVRDHTEVLLKTRYSAITLPKFVMDVLCSQACHGAVKFGSALEKSECIKIVRALSKCSLPFQCAHGRPSITPIVDLRFLPPEEKAPWKPNFAALCSRVKGSG
ncbi:DNA mismatch repair protein Mlh3-like isoform X2 [Haemaphysalis longicornis]